MVEMDAAKDTEIDEKMRKFEKYVVDELSKSSTKGDGKGM